MIENYEYTGIWWLPSDDSNKLSGTLTINRGRAELQVLDSFGHARLNESETEAILGPFPSFVPRILGMTTNGKEITLEGCASGGSTMSFPGIPTTKYRPRAVFVGVWFTEDEQIGIDEIAISTTELDTWTCISGFAQNLSGIEQPETGLFVPTAIDVHFEPPASIPIPLDDGVAAKIDFAFKHTGMGPVTKESHITQTASFNLAYPQAQDFASVQESVGRIRNFLSLAIGRPVTVLGVTGYANDLVRPGSMSRVPIQLLWELVHNPEPADRPLHPAEMLFTLPEAEPGISEAMRAWFSQQDLLRPVFNLYFGMLYHPNMYRDVHFLAYAQAIETYDFRRRDATDLPVDEHELRLAAILASSPAEHREWLRDKLLSSNLLTLRRRIRDVLNECPTVRDKIVGPTGGERRAFISGFVDSRNYYTHYNPAGEHTAAKGAALYLLVVQLRAIIEMSLLRELGFSCAAIDRVLDRVRRYAEVDHLKAVVADEATHGNTIGRSASDTNLGEDDGA